MLPFDRQDFLGLFSDYNAAVWPAQAAAYTLGAAALLALIRRGEGWQRFTLATLGAMWLWTGIAYHWLFFSEINPAAVIFAAMFIVQGLAFARLAIARPLSVRFTLRTSCAGVVGSLLIGAAFFLYPIIDLLMMRWPPSAAFGISPCPLTLLTLGLLLLATPRPSLGYWIIPLLWSLIGGTAAVLLGIPQDWVLLAGGPAALIAAFLVGREESSDGPARAI